MKQELETETCSRCNRHTSFEWDETEGWQSVCCGWPEKKLPE